MHATKLLFEMLKTFILFAVATLSAVTPIALRPSPGAETVLFFDGVCGLCNGFVNFIAARDSERRIKFASIQNHTDWLEALGAPTDLSTMVLLQENHVYLHSAGPLKAIALLDAPWCIIAVGYFVPSFIRDAVYKIVAANRYNWFGIVSPDIGSQCVAPSEDYLSRIVGYRAKSAGVISDFGRKTP